MCNENRSDPPEQSASTRIVGPRELQSATRRCLASDSPGTGKGSDHWRRLIQAVYEDEYERFVRYAAGCLWRNGQMGIQLAIEPEDLVHDSVLFVLQEMHQPGVAGRMPTEGWKLGDCVVAAISNRCAALAKRDSRRARCTRASVATDSSTMLVNPVDADSEAETILLKARVRAAVDNLPPMQRLAVEQLDLNDRSVREVAEDLRRAENTLRNHRKRARERLRQALGPH